MVDSDELGPAYDRVEECAFDVMAVVPRLNQVNLALGIECDVVLLGCTEKMLLSPSFQARVARFSQRKPVVAVVPGLRPEIATDAAKLGLQGLVAREVPPDAVERTVIGAMRGELAFPRGALAILVGSIAHGSPRNKGVDPDDTLTPRQRQIVDLIARGATDSEIATFLKISRSTAHKHVQNALRRTKARTRSQLVAATR